MAKEFDQPFLRFSDYHGLLSIFSECKESENIYKESEITRNCYLK